MKNLKKYFTRYSITAFILIGILLYSGVGALRINIPQYLAARKFIELKIDNGIDKISADDALKFGNEPNKELTKLYKKNKDFVAWLSIPKTPIDYPVMKSAEDNPEFYLHHGFDKKYSDPGSLFIGQGCDENSDVFVVYGHNMNADTMFGTLDDYENPGFATKNPDIIFRTIKDTRVYRVFAAFRTKIYKNSTNNYEYYNSVGDLDKEEYDDVVNNIRKLSIISLNEAPKNKEQIILLSTCAYHTNEGRFVVAAYKK